MPAKTVQARVLVDSAYGRPNDVVKVPEAEAAQGLLDGVLDPTPEAVAYALSLVPAEPAQP